MPTGLRRFQKTRQMHFVTFSCYRRQPKLGTPHAQNIFEQSLEGTRQAYGFCVAGYVVMPEHVHLLLTEPGTTPLATALQALKQSVSRTLALRAPQPFWQARYYDFNVWSDKKRIEKLRYIHRNPVARGLVQQPEDWPWSSFLHCATGIEGTVEIESEWTARKRANIGIRLAIRRAMLLSMHSAQFIESAAACLSNGERLIEDARWLPDHRPATKFALATIAQEEFAKAFLLFLASRDVLIWNSLIFRTTRDHASKQLLGLVMNYMNPTWDDFEKRVTAWREEHEKWEKLMASYKAAVDRNERDRAWNQLQEFNEQHRDLPQAVADAVNILRHEKIGRWKSSNWFWDQEPIYDAMAKSLADGRRDIEKQDALYVRIGAKGGLAKTPDEVKPEDAAEASEMAGRFGSLIDGLLSGDNVNSVEFEKIESMFKRLFSSLNEDVPC